ncbi:MAG: hypothetical protein ACLQIB_47560 [Isosphaeraceae bacterium]
MARIPLPGGAMETAIGPIPWLDFAGRRFENVRSICVISHRAGFADPVCAGNLGQVLCSDFRITFDFPNRRIALTT